MAFGDRSTARRSSLGRQASGVAANRPTAAPAGPSSGQGRGGEGRQKSTWTTATTLYDPYHSAMEPQVVTEFYRTSLAIKLAPVFQERRGPEDGTSGTGKKYDYEQQMLVVLDLGECIVLREQLSAFLNHELSEIVLARGDTKRLVFCNADQFYPSDSPEYSLHVPGLCVSIEQDQTEKAAAGTVVFVSRQQQVVLADGADPTVFYPELQALLSVIESYITNCARLDFGSCRLLEQRGGGEDRPAGPAAAMPTRNRTGIGAPTNRPAPGASSDGAASSPAPAPASSTGVGDSDLDDALGGDVQRF